MSSHEVISLFSSLGGVFSSPNDFVNRFKNIKALIFDWDGVFNQGYKDIDGASPFSEIDSVGTNMLRYAIWRSKGNHQPICAIISGQRNPISFKFAKREHFNAVYGGSQVKLNAGKHFAEQFGLKPTEIAFFFDDAIDLGLAEWCGLRIAIARNSAPLLRQFISKNNLADYITAHQGGDNGLREACEMLMGLLGQYDDCIDGRRKFTDDYKAFLTDRNKPQTILFTETSQGFKPEELK